MQLRTILTLALAVTACGNKKDDKHAEPTSAAMAQEKPAKQAVTAELFGSKPHPLGPIAKLETAMTIDQVKTLAPDLMKGAKDDYASVNDPALEGVRYAVQFGKDNHKVVNLSMTVPKGAQALLEKAWGPGKPAQDTIKRPRTYWFDPAGGWRAYLEPGFGDNAQLNFSRYTPVATLLGDAPDKLGFAPDGILGATIEDLRKRFPDTLVETDAATAAKQQAEVGKLVGKDLDKVVGKAKPSVRLDLLPTEWNEYNTRIQISWGDDGKVKDVWFDVDYGAHDPAKEELRALFEQHWGKPKPGKWIVEAVDVYHAKDPWIAAADNTIMKAWTLHVQPAPPR